MRKGEARRAAIIETAEKLFYQHGYEETSIQQVLDALDLSKGGFYHHFESKQALLEAVCQQRAEEACQRGESAARAEGLNCVERLNALFQMGSVFGQENMEFVNLSLKTVYQDGFSALKDMLHRIFMARFLPIVNDIIYQGVAEKVFYTAMLDQVGRLLLMLFNDVTDAAAALLAQRRATSECVAQILELLSAYRRAMELLLDAPYGSIRIYDAQRVADIIRALAKLP